MVAFGHEPTLVAALAIAALTVAVIVLRPGAILHRALALLLLFEALHLGLSAFATGIEGPINRLYVYAGIALPFAALNFGYVFWQENRPGGPNGPLVRGLTRLVILLAGGTILWLYLVDHDLYAGVDARGYAVPGPLSLFSTAYTLSLALLAWMLALAYQRADTAPRQRSFYLVGLGFAVIPTFRGAFWVTNNTLLLFSGPGSTLARIEAVLNLVALAALLWIVLVTLGRATARPAPASDRLHYAALLGLVALTAVSVFVIPVWLPALLAIRAMFFFNALWHVSFVALATYAVLRYELFGIELRTKLALRQSTVVATLALLFLVSSEVLEALLGISKTFIAIVVAVGLAFVFRRIQVFAERLVGRLMPDVEANEAYLRRRRHEVYRAAVEVVVRDGTVAPEEVRLLSRLRERLQIAPADARGIEHALGAEITPPAPVLVDDLRGYA